MSSLGNAGEAAEGARRASFGLRSNGGACIKMPVSDFVRVAVPVPLGQAFSYRVPPLLAARVRTGARVLCEFGKRKVLGVVLSLESEPPEGFDVDKIKPLLAVVDEEPALTEELLTFLEALAAYYAAPIGEVLRMALPAVEREQVSGETRDLFQQAKVQTVGRLVQVAVPAPELPEAPLPRGQAKQLLQAVRATPGITVLELLARFSNARAAVKRLERAGFLRLEQQARRRERSWERPTPPDSPKLLNDEQANAVSSVIAALEAAEHASFLLHGVTGSGKTEVYLHAVSRCLELQGGAIVLVPEIALTPQLVGRFRARLGDRIAVIHSGLSNSERQHMWRALRSAELSVVVGARSALFAPVSRLRLICVDEEHDSSFKQEEGVRYHARDMALLRAHRAGAVCVLGSATPSLASEALVRAARVQRLKLPRRAVEGARLPAVEVVDLKVAGPGPGGERLLTLPLYRALQATLEQGQQAILFLNRRGFAPSLICESCGKIVECPNCTVALTLHRSRGERLRCHYCDYAAPLPQQCEECRSQRLSYEGTGTERIEHALTELFPDRRIARLDRDVASGLKSQGVLDRMRRREVDVLIGTQMVTKGHDLPGVALVGVLNADAALSLPDYQASERTFQLLVQVSGRAGRGEVPGRVLVQTRNADHPAIRHALTHDVEAFVEHELGERREANYPPFRRLLMIRIDALDDRLAQDAAERIGARLARLCQQYPGDAAELLGPSPAPMLKLRNRYRYRCLMRAKGRRPLFAAARHVLNMEQDRRVRVSVDMDPVSML